MEQKTINANYSYTHIWRVFASNSRGERQKSWVMVLIQRGALANLRLLNHTEDEKENIFMIIVFVEIQNILSQKIVQRVH